MSGEGLAASIAASGEMAVAGVAPDERVVVRGLGKSYGTTRVLDGVDLTLAPHSLVAVAGRNGAGKSTLLACLAGTVRHDGRVMLDGRAVGRRTSGRIAYLPQRLRLPAAATGAEVMRLFARLGAGAGAGVPLPDGFVPDLDRPVGQLSGGQAQRVALAAILQGRPDLVLLDEPFANLDDAAREAAHRLLRAHRDAGATVLVASPTAMDLLAVTDRVLLVEDAGIAFDGAPGRYASRLEMTLWVRPGGVPAADVTALPHVLRSHAEGEWLAILCHEDRVVGLIREIETLGITGDAVRLGGPAADPRHSMSPGRAGEGADR
jgi:ABC-type multidrug transport system ATPase subunit